jgi:hypothetical protein
MDKSSYESVSLGLNFPTSRAASTAQRETLNSRPAPPPAPIEHCPAPFLGLTVQPCREPCGSVAGSDFLTVKVIQIKKQKNLS